MINIKKSSDSNGCSILQPAIMVYIRSEKIEKTNNSRQLEDAQYYWRS